MLSMTRKITHLLMYYVLTGQIVNLALLRVGEDLVRLVQLLELLLGVPRPLWVL